MPALKGNALPGQEVPPFPAFAAEWRQGTRQPDPCRKVKTHRGQGEAGGWVPRAPGGRPGRSQAGKGAQCRVAFQDAAPCHPVGFSVSPTTYAHKSTSHTGCEWLVLNYRGQGGLLLREQRRHSTGEGREERRPAIAQVPTLVFSQ